MRFCLSLRPLSWCLGSFCPLAGMMHHGVRFAWHQLPDLFYPVLHWGKISTITSLCIRSPQPADIVYKIPYCPVVSIAFLGQISILHPSCQRGKTSRHVLPEWIAFKSTLLMYANTTSKARYIPAFLFPDTRSGVAWKPWKWKLLGHIVILNRHSIVITLSTSLNTHRVNEVRTLSDGRHPEHGKTGFTKKHAVDGRQHLGSCFLC